MVSILKNLLAMSLSGSIVILLVLALRLILQKAPARLMCLLWLLVGLRLVLPFHIEADFSLQPDTQQLLQPVVSDRVSAPQEYVPQDMIPAMPTMGENITVNTDVGVTTTVQRTMDWMSVAAYIWAAGVAGMLAYTLTSYVRLKRQVRGAIWTADGAWECDSLNGPFLLGYIKPRIFLPAGITGSDREYVLSHERTHLAWGDHWTKLVGFLCLSLHWFNPLVWLAYWCLCKDLETACDEQVVRGYDVEKRKAYSKALLACSAGSRPVSACPVAFGEVNVKERIMKVLNYRKPGFWICLVCVVAIIGAAVFFLTDPLKEMTMEDYVALIGTERSELLKKLGVDEEDVTYSEASRLYLLPEKVQFNGREYQIYCDMGETFHNQAASFKFVSITNEDEQTSIEDFASEYLALQAQFTEQFGESRRTNIYWDAQQIVDAYENRRRSEVGAWVIDTPWEVYEGIPYSNIIEFLKEMLTWDEVTYLGKWHGRDMDGLLRVSLQGEYLDGSAVFKINYRADVMPASTAVKYGTIFEEYASGLGRYNEEFFNGLEVNKDKISYTDHGAFMWEQVEYEGIAWSIGTHSVKEMDDRVTHVAFADSPASLDEMAEKYDRLLELLKRIYGEPVEEGDRFSDFEQIREAFDKKETVVNPVMYATWSFDQSDDIVTPHMRYVMSEMAKSDYAKESIKRIYGSDAIPKPVFHIHLGCHAGVGESDDNGVITEYESYSLNVIFSIKLTPEYP